MNHTQKRPTVADRLDARTDKTGECWIWMGAKSTNGYGYMSVGNKVQPVHRLAYQAYVGEIPEGHDIDHVCFLRNCIRPDHLRTVTRKQNMEHLSGAYATSQSGVRGVHYWEARNTWVAELWHHSRPIRVGYFKTMAEADAAVRAKRQELYTHDDATY